MTSPDQSDGQNPAALLFQNQRNRVDISSIISAYERGEYVSTLHPDALFDAPRGALSRTEAFAVWTEAKSECYALASLCIRDVWSSFERERDARLTMFSVPRPNTMQKLKTVTGVLFQNALENWVSTQENGREMDKTRWSPMTRVYDRLARMVRFNQKYTISDDSTLEEFIMRGVGTASHVTWATIDLVPKLSHIQQLQISKSQAIGIINRAYSPIIGLFSHMNLNIAVSYLDHLFHSHLPYFKPEYFSLIEKNGVLSLSLDHAKLLPLADDQDRIIVDLPPFGQTVTCPANYAVADSGDTVIKEYFDWSVAMADRHLDTINQLDMVHS